MSFFSGVFNSSINPAELNVRSFAGTMLRLFPNGGFPLWGLLSQQPKSVAKSSTHGYFSKTLQFAASTSKGINVAGATAFDITSSAGLTAGMVLYNPRTRENMRITAIVDADTVTVVRAFGRVAAADTVDLDPLIVIGSSFEEGSARPTPRGMTTIYVANYTQIFRNAWAVTDTARASLVEAGLGNIQENRKDCSILHSVDCESAILFGQPSAPAGGTTGPLHATQGIYDAIDQYAPANTNTAGATTTFAQLVTMMEPAFLYSTDMGNTKERIAFCGMTAMKVLNDLGRLSGQVYITQNETSFGMQFTKFKFYKGTINLVEHPLFNSNPAFAKLMVVLELASIKLAFMNGRDTKSEEFGGDGKNNAGGADSVGGSLTSEFAVEYINPFSGAVVENLTEAAA